MREFERTEVMREKCHLCGSKNKMYSNLIYNGTVVGRNIRCCNCGNNLKFLYPKYQDLNNQFINGVVKAGSSVCIQESYCPFKDCPLYGTCKAPGSQGKSPVKINPNRNDFPNQSELVVNTSKEPKYL